MRLEVVVAIGAVRRQRGADADVGGGLRRALHEPPHVEHRGRAAPDGLGVGHVGRGAGDLGRERPVGGVDVVLEPLPERHRLRRAPQQTRSAGDRCGARGSRRASTRRSPARWQRPGGWPPRRVGRRPRSRRRPRAPSPGRGPSARRPSAARCRRGSARCSSPWPCRQHGRSHRPRFPSLGHLHPRPDAEGGDQAAEEEMV